MTLIAFLATALFATAPAAAASDPAQALAQGLAGSWTSAEQAASTPGYDPIRTTVVRLPILSPEAPGAVWLFTESAREATLDKPYRRNATRLTSAPDGRVRVVSYRLKDPARAIAGVTLADLVVLEGCEAVFAQTASNGFEGAMAPRACRNHYKGADWLDSRTTLTPTAMITWDRGMTEAGARVWGPEAGGYRFTRIAAGPR